MKMIAIRLTAVLLTLNSCLVPRIAHGQSSSPLSGLTVPDEVQARSQLLIIRQHLVQARIDLDKHGSLSSSTTLGLGAAAAGIGMMAGGFASLRMSKSAYDAFVRVGNAGQFVGIGVFGGSIVLSSIFQQAKELLNKSIRSDFVKSSQDLLTLIDQAIASPELDSLTRQEILTLREKVATNVSDLSRAPWYIKTVNFVDYSVSFLGLLFIGASLASGHPGGIVGAAFVMVPVATVTTIFRALDEARTIQNQKKVLKRSIEHLDRLIQMSETKTLLIMP